MMNEGLSAGDILALTRDQDGMGNAWNNPLISLVWLALLGGTGGLPGRRHDSTLQSSLTRSDLFEGFNNQDINSQLRGITNGLCDGFYAVNNGLKDGFYGNQGTMKDGFYGIHAALAENRFAQQNCCCEIKGGIKDLSAEGYRNTCEITTAIHTEREATRALINSNTMQELRDKLAEKDREVQARDFQLSQIAQTNNIVGQIKPCPVPAYVTCNPWGSSHNYNNGCACGI